MKNIILLSAVGFLASAFLTGCGEKPSASSKAASKLTASDLATLMDFHAWNVPIPPQSQQAIKKIRLLIVQPDGTTIQKFTTANADSISCSSIFLGFRVQDGKFSGHFNMRDTNGGGEGYNLNFMHTFTNSDLAWAWAGETPPWNGNRAILAQAVDRDGREDSSLAIELVK
jgi:hypothetical protein